MSTKGNSTLLFAPLAEDDPEKVTVAAKKLAALIDMKPTLTIGDTVVYADDVPQESDNSVTGGKLAFTVYNEDVDIINPVLGKKGTKKQIAGASDKEITDYESNGNDEPQYIKLGYIQALSGGRYKAIMFKKVKLSPYETESKTKEDKTTYTHSEIEGTIFLLDDGSYKLDAVCANKDDAVKTLQSFFVVKEAA